MLLEPSEKGFLILRQQMLKVKRKGIVSFVCSGAVAKKSSLRYFCSNSRENPSGSIIQRNYREFFVVLYS